MYDAQSPCLAEGQRNIVFIHQHLYILKSAHLTKSSGALKKKKHLEHLLCDGKDDNNLLFLYVCPLSVTRR